MAILFDDATDAGTLQSLQGKVAELAVTAQSTLQKEHSANGQHTAITVDSIRSRTGAVVPVSAGVRWTGGPLLVAPPAVIRPPALTATTHNWNPPGLAKARVIEIKATGAVTLTGLAVQGPLRTERRLLTLVNQSAFALTLPNYDAGSETWQRFWFGGTDYVLAAGTTLDLYYDPTQGLQAWRGPQAVTGGGGSTMSTTAPTMTFNAAGNIRASSTLAASGTATYDVDYSAKYEGQLHVKNTPGGTVAANRGVRVDIFRRYGSTPTIGESAFLTMTVPSQVASTAESGDLFVPTGKYTLKLTNLDATNAVTVEITGDTVDTLTTT